MESDNTFGMSILRCNIRCIHTESDFFTLKRACSACKCTLRASAALTAHQRLAGKSKRNCGWKPTPKHHNGWKPKKHYLPRFGAGSLYIMRSELLHVPRAVFVLLPVIPSRGLPLSLFLVPSLAGRICFIGARLKLVVPDCTFPVVLYHLLRSRLS